MILVQGRPARILLCVLCASLAAGAGFGQPAAYHETLPAEVSAVEKRGWKVLESAVGASAYGTDGALVWAARDLCALIGEAADPGAGPTLDPRLVEQALLGRGVTDSQASPFASSATSADAVVSSFAEHVAEKPGSYQGRVVGIGAAQVQDRVLMCVLSVKRGVSLDVLPRQLEVPGRIELSGQMEKGVTGVEVVVASPAGEVITLPVSVQGKSFTAVLPLDGEQGTYMVEVLGDTAFGPEVLNLFPITVGKGGPDVAKVVLSVPWREGGARNAWMLFDLVNADRVDRGLGSLAPDADLSEVALAHCRDMRDSAFFGHVSPTFGDLAARTGHLAGIGEVAEAIALAASPQRAYANLMGSPAHAASLRSGAMTSMGVGKVKTDDGMLFTVVVAAR